MPAPDDPRAYDALFDAPEPSAEQRAAVRLWQATDRFYERVQDFARGLSTEPRAGEAHDALAELIRGSRTALPLTAWRGNRDARKATGLDVTALESLIGVTHRLTGFVAASLDWTIAVHEFTRPPLRGGAFLVQLRIPIGVHVGWLPPIGSERLRYQQELLLYRPTVRYWAVDRRNPALPVLVCEVMNDDS
ncbi:hypothetical protein [Gordonia sp. (in: high G+C Gram-positive bacteria)]|uniref:hypothetical protein n=1 Tax=Gordonia sp. (in: high G+C Gram-positive bacteria) TaxID=84139 RepID=UPI00260C777C|nr:hypothetical protein [Gordonia sp. (in: high G+C Gram-positive bacteria)]